MEVQALLVPILEAVDRFGLKAWHLRKFLKDVERFYEKNIIGREYTSERGRDVPEAVRPLPGQPLHVPDAGRHPVGEQHGGEGDPSTGRAAEDLGLVLQAGRPRTTCCCWPSPRRAASRASRSSSSCCRRKPTWTRSGGRGQSDTPTPSGSLSRQPSAPPCNGGEPSNDPTN